MSLNASEESPSINTCTFLEDPSSKGSTQRVNVIENVFESVGALTR